MNWKQILLLPLGLVAGAAGGGAVALLLPRPAEVPAPAPVEPGDGHFVTMGALLVPVTLSDGQFTAYVTVEPQLEVAEGDQEGVTARLPLVIHAVNVRVFRTPLGSGPDGRLPNVAIVRAIVAEEAGKVLGRGVVRSVAVTRIAPA